MMLKTLTVATLCCLTLALSATCAAPSAYAATEIYFVRHAETMGNVTHHHNHKNDRTLSPKGRRQVAALTRKLDRVRFDHIIVSPKYRALKTIIPYLKKHRQVAEIWPELAECCWQKHRELSADAPRRKSQIMLETAMKAYFTFADAEDRFSYDTHGYGQGVLQTFIATERITQQFSGSNERILIVGHYHAGSRLIEIVQGLKPVGRYKISNTQILRLRENSDGGFSLLNSPE